MPSALTVGRRWISSEPSDLVLTRQTLTHFGEKLVAKARGVEGEPKKTKLRTMKRLLLGSLFLTALSFTSISPASGASCEVVRTGMKIVGSQISFSSEKSASQLANAYRLAFENPQCFSAKQIKSMKKAARDLISECKNPNSVLANVAGQRVWKSFCKGFVALERYTKA